MSLTLREKINQYALIELSPDLTQFPREAQLMVKKLISLKPAFDSLFMKLNTRQGHEINRFFQDIFTLGGPDLAQRIDEYLFYLDINKGNRDFLTTKRFLPEFTYDDLRGIPELRADNSELAQRLESLRAEIFSEGFVETGFYPPGTTKESLFKKQNETGKKFDGKFSVVREIDGKWVEVPYTDYFKDELTKIGDGLTWASMHASEAGYNSLSKKLTLLKFALVTGGKVVDEYWKYALYEFNPSESPFNIHFNFEEYPDHLVSTEDGKWVERNVKGAYNFLVTMRDDESTRLYNEHLQFMNEMEINLPVEEARRPNVDLQKTPSAFYRTLVLAGGCDTGAKILAWVIPNKPYDALGREQIGLSDALEGKQSMILEKIVEACLDPELVSKYKGEIRNRFMALHSMRHEASHALGKQADEYESLQDYGTSEEGKAESGSIYVTSFIANKHLSETSYVQMLRCMADFLIAGQIRQIRFGLGSEHARSASLVQNTLIDEGAVEIRDGRLYGDTDKILNTVINKVYPDLLRIAATADNELLQKYRSRMEMRKEVRDILEGGLSGVPTDIRFYIQLRYGI